MARGLERERAARAVRREQLRAHAAALDALASGLGHNLGVESRIRRLVRRFLDAGRTLGDPVMALAAESVVQCNDLDLPERLATLRGTLGRVLDHEEVFATIRILVVEDDPAFAAVLQTIMAAPDREVVHVGTVQEAREVFASELFDLVLLDLSLPDGDGRELFDVLRRFPVDIRPEIHVVSATGDPLLREECLALGAAAVYRKPLDVGTLVATLSARIALIAEQGLSQHHDPDTGLLNELGLRRRWEVMNETFEDGQASVLFLTTVPDPIDAHTIAALARCVSAVLDDCSSVARLSDDLLVVVLVGRCAASPDQIVEAIESAWDARTPEMGASEVLCEVVELYGDVELAQVLSVGRWRIEAGRSLARRVASELNQMFGETLEETGS